MSDYADRNGHPITVERFLELRDDPDYVHIARDEVKPLVVVTEWIGMPPRLFETLIMGITGFEDGETRDIGKWWTSESEALAGHSFAMTQARNIAAALNAPS